MNEIEFAKAFLEKAKEDFTQTLCISLSRLLKKRQKEEKQIEKLSEHIFE